MAANDTEQPGNVVRLRRPEIAQASPNPTDKHVFVNAWKRMSPKEAREFAVGLLYMADVAEGCDDGIGAFGYDAQDSHELERLRGLIDEHLGWEDDEQEVDGDYAARVVQVGKILKDPKRKVDP